jgi:hypothetical protein
MPSRKATRPDDGRIRANRPPERQARPKPNPSRYEQLLSGALTVDDLDDEEILRGQCRDKNGNFTGRPPTKYPRALHNGLRKEFQNRINQRWNEGADIALSTLIEVMQSRMAAAPARVRAAEIWMERVQGKVPDKVEQTIELKAFEEDVDSLLVDVGDTKADNVVPFKRQDKTA